jgi:hypothetical protein
MQSIGVDKDKVSRALPVVSRCEAAEVKLIAAIGFPGRARRSEGRRESERKFFSVRTE